MIEAIWSKHEGAAYITWRSGNGKTCLFGGSGLKTNCIVILLGIQRKDYIIFGKGSILGYRCILNLAKIHFFLL